MIKWGWILEDLKKNESEIRDKKKFNEVYNNFFKANPLYGPIGYVNNEGKKVFPKRDEKLYLFNLFFEIIETRYTT